MTSPRKSRRELLLILAKKMELSLPLGISDHALINLIDRQPATERQLLILGDMLPRGHQLPEGMTYGRARRAIQLAMETLNEGAVASMKLQEGSVRYWRGMYIYIMSIGSAADQYRVWFCVVKLHRPAGAAKAVVRQMGDRKYKAHPVNMLYASFDVNLATWQPDFRPAERFDPDEPLF